MDIEDGIERAVEEFNRYRSPEATIVVKEKRDDVLVAEFTGPFCVTCGVTDYFEDLIILLEENNVKAVPVDVRESDNGFTVRFSIEDKK